MNSWKDFILAQSKLDYYKKLSDFVIEDAKQHTIYPAHKDIFNAFKLCPLDKVKVVIIGQDPYINPNQAHGLSFSVPRGEPIPPSLRNIFKEIKSDLDNDSHNFSSGNLEGWASQGVLLLNSVLTVRQGQSGSHKNKGWETFTDAAISLLDKQERPIVYLLWGSFAKSKRLLLNNKNHFILESGHPSPMSSSLFFGNKHFSKTNNFLSINSIPNINWFQT